MKPPQWTRQQVEAVLDHHHSAGAAFPDARRAVPGMLAWMFDLVVRRWGIDDRIDLDQPEARSFEKWRTGYASAYAIILFVTVFGGVDLRQALNKGEER